MTRVLFLDDNEDRQRRAKQMFIGCVLVQAWDHTQAIAALDGERFDIAHLDHDLSDAAALGMAGPDEKTGTHVAEYIAAMPPEKRPARCVVHTFNEAGRKRMMAILHDAGVPVIAVPFGRGRVWV